MIKVIVKKIEWSKLEREFDTLSESLYPARREAVERLNNKKAKLSSMATGLLLQELVRAELGVEPIQLIIGRGSQGKPYVEGYPEFNFNISHSGDVVAIAYGDCQVGIDVEHIRCRENDLKVAKRCFAPGEYTFITDEAFEVDLEGVSHSVEERFFMVWTMKEAYLKYKGTGISVPMNSFQVKPYEGIIGDENLSCHLVAINDYVYSVCVDGGAQVDISFE